MRRILLSITLVLVTVFTAHAQFPKATAQVTSTAKESGHAFKAAPISLLTLSIASDSDQYILVMDSATVPVDGAVTLLFPPIHVGANTITMIEFSVPIKATVGISVSNSNASSFTKTAGAADCIYTAQLQ